VPFPYLVVVELIEHAAAHFGVDQRVVAGVVHVDESVAMGLADGPLQIRAVEVHTAGQPLDAHRGRKQRKPCDDLGGPLGASLEALDQKGRASGAPERTATALRPAPRPATRVRPVAGLR
jgi:hypothetical protein